MKKFIFIMPLMAISLLASCSGGDKPGPSPQEDVEFSVQESLVALKDNKAIIHLDWTPNDHSIEFNNFTFTLKDQSSITSIVTPKDVTSRPLELTIAFNSALNKDDAGNLKFHFNDKTAKKEGDYEVKDINVSLAATYTITWENYNGDALEVDDNVLEGTIPTYDGDTPTRDDEDPFTYTFDGWNKNVIEANESTTYRATFTKRTKDGSTLIKISIPESENDGELKFGFFYEANGSITVNWGDGPDETDVSTHTYAAAGDYNITISNNITSLYFFDYEQWDWIDGASYLKEVYLGDSITEIRYFAFAYHFPNITDISIPSTVTSIGDNAFSECEALININLPNTMASIGDAAFYGCKSLEHIIIPNSVVNLGEEVFQYCPSLMSLVVRPNNPFFDSRKNCNAIVTTSTNELIVGCPGTVIPDGVTSIGEYAFNYSSPVNVIIPNSVTSIKECAFCFCNELVNISIPNSIISISYNAIFDCGNLQYNESDNGKYLGNDENNYLVLMGLIDTSVSSFTFNSSCKLIGPFAFKDCSDITSIVIPNTITSICDYGLSFLGIMNINIPSGVNFIGLDILGGCSNLNIVKVDASNPKYRDFNSNAIFELNDDQSSYTLIAGYKGTSIPSDKNVTAIAEDAFSATAIVSLIIPDSVDSIGARAFSECASLTSINIPNKVTSIEYFTFAFCSSLTSIVIPSSVTYISDYSFYYCESLGVVDLTSLSTPPILDGQDAFYGAPTTFYVKQDTKSLYLEADNWKEFDESKFVEGNPPELCRA